jgi:hypothetical protein
MPENNKLARYAAIFEDIKAGDIMSTNVVEISGDKKIAHAKGHHPRPGIQQDQRPHPQDYVAPGRHHPPRRFPGPGGGQVR